MASSEQPQTPPLNAPTPATTDIQTPPDSMAPEGTSPIPLSPLPRPPAVDPAKFLRLRGWLDALLVALVLLFAFLVALFPAVNADFFRQLATGRLILQGGYHFGVDPFVYTADDTYVVNHSWLFALLMYGLYQLPSVGGGAAVVIFKAVLIAALAEVLLRAGRRAGQSLWIPAACTALAILALSPRLHLQSVCVSLLFLAVTLWLLPASRGRWLLPPLFALWVNYDSWFLLGPLTVALYLLGELLQQWFSSRAKEPGAPLRGELRSLGLVLIVGLAACLANPHHVRAFTLPVEFGLSAADDLIGNDSQFQLLFLSPLWKEYYDPRLGLSVAGLAYWPLLLVGAASCVLAFGRAPWGRLLVWLGFALLSLYNAHCIAFFAVVAAPITALNWLDYAAGRLGLAPPLTRGRRSWALGGRTLTVLAVLALLIATVPGWLQAGREYRRLGWHVRVDPSLETMAQTIHEWRQAGKLDEPHWFNMQQEVANYLAWFAPGERVFFNHSLPHLRKAAEDYLTVRQGLEQEIDKLSNADGDAIVLKKNWRKVLRDRRVRYWIFDNSSNHKPDRIAHVMLLSNPDEWIPCYLQGRIAIFAWRDPQPAEGSVSSKNVPALDLKRAAFGPKAEPAPPRGPEPLPPPAWWQAWWDAWRQPVPPASIDRESILLYDSRFQLSEEQMRRRRIYFDARAWQGGVAAGAIASSLSRGPMPNSLLALSWCCTYHHLFPPEAMQPARPGSEDEVPAMRALVSFLNGRPIEPAPSLYLAVRAARRALLVNPEDGTTYFRLGQAYQRLAEQPQENNPRTPAPQLAILRRTQMAAAFQNCLRFPSDLSEAAQLQIQVQAHEALFGMCAQLGYLDAALHHLRQMRDKWAAAGPPPGTSSTPYNQQLERLDAEITRREAELQGKQNSYELRTVSKSGLEKVQVALELGLTDTAQTALEEAAQENISFFNANEQAIIRRMKAAILDLGRLDKARELLPDVESTSGQAIRPEEVDLYLRLAVARGDYEEADRLVADALRDARQTPPEQIAVLLGRVMLAEALPLTGIPRLPIPHPLLPSEFWINLWRREAIHVALLSRQQQAEGTLTRGWLALEAGRCAEARRHFQAIHDIPAPDERWLAEVDRLDVLQSAKRDMPTSQQLSLRHRVLHELSANYLRWLEAVQ